MDNEEPEAEAATPEFPGSPAGTPGEPPERSMTRTERRLRKLAGRKSPYEGPIIGIARGWVSRDGRMHFLAARFLDFAVLTPDHLVLCSTGFFTRRPRRRVFRDSLSRIEVTPLGGEPVSDLVVGGNFRHAVHDVRRELEVVPSVKTLVAAWMKGVVRRARSVERDVQWFN